LIRKHRIALLAAAVYNLVLFFPTAFLGRILSPNDVFFNFPPWSSVRQTVFQNLMLNDPPTSYYTLMALLRHGGSFHWNPFIACGIPGVGSSAAAVLSPFVLLPALALPAAWIYSGIVLLKFNAAFFFAYLWLREERLGKRGAAVGALVVAGAGVISVQWLWQSTNAAALYPALLWLVRRRRASIALTTLIGAAYALAGFPAAMAYGVYTALLASIPRLRTTFVKLAAGGILALVIAAPSLVPFVQFLQRSGYLETRAAIGASAVYPLSHWGSLVDPLRLGSPASKDWSGDRALGSLNNFKESTIYLGIAPLLLAPFAFLRRRTPAKWFWLAFALLIAGAIFGAFPLLARLPGFKYSPLARLVILLPLPAGYLAAAGASWWIAKAKRLGVVVAIVLSVWCAYDLSLFAGRFYPYLEPAETVVPATPAIRFLNAQPGPFRVAAFFDYLWPNAAEMFRFEDIRAHFGSEAKYRRLIQRIDPSAWNGQSTMLQLDSRRFDFSDPLVGMLGVRYVLEHKTIDIIKWSIFARTTPGARELHAFHYARPGEVLERTIPVDVDPFWAIELPVSVESAVRGARMTVTLTNGGGVVYARDFAPGDITPLEKVYVPVRPWARQGDRLTLRVQPSGMRIRTLRAEAPPGESPFYYGRVATPLIFDRELPDGRVFLNLAEVPRFHPVKRLRPMSDDAFLAARDVDFASEAVTATGAPRNFGDASVELLRYTPGEQRLVTRSAGPFFLASSEKLTPELRVTIDGRTVPLVGINMLFAGVEVPAGEHRVVFSRRIARGIWWPLAGIALVVWCAIAVVEIRQARRRE
jgi:hypothetical protein